ncbi:hypothetical protein GO495_09080 [Chitinophaga oryziterrae]|uniref:Uncharacterized protein n=1 Tax=Chitinophaga oryziterrae TaxID=1031224 RepID=A0A6N8J930_9BACT|nr:hypothetical protein [Chitinophaga oryziterrae]MVT40729.1 hypothetical protein [Chitinophaga oryziterrae]
MESTEIISSSFFHFTHLNEQELKHPELAINKFCELFPLAEVRQTLGLWLNETLAAQDTYYDNAENRSNLMLVYNQLLYLLDANYLLNKQLQEPAISQEFTIS